jgi:acyl-CoA synthetase (AMP-forming)/AMP-acid ligase II
MAVAFLGVSASCVCAPLNPAYRIEEFEFYLRDLDAAAIVIEGGAEGGADSPARVAATGLGIGIIELEKSAASAGVFELSDCTLARPGQVRAAVASGATSDPAPDTALVLHTSGTTSKPKIVPLTLANLSVSAAQVAAGLQLTSGDRCLNIMPLFHIHGIIAALLASLHSGGSVYCTGGLAVETFFTSWLPDYRPTWYTAVPTMHQALLQYVTEFGARTALDDHCLRLIRSSSSSLAPQLMHALEARFGVPVIEAYGMTEAAHQMASNPLPPARRKVGSVGIAAGPQVAIMAETDSRILSDAEIGEIVIKGPNIALGYLDNDEANRNAFADGWFRTGDQGYFDAEGYLFITGRLKEIINRGGEKVSPREVDEAVLAVPGVAQAVTFAVPHERLGEDVAVAVVLEQNATLDARAIRAVLFERIAEFKIPSRIVFVDDIPKGSTGKLQRIGLAEKLADQMANPYAAPISQFEELIADVFAEALGIERVGRTDNFFGLGGDSLQGMLATNRLSAMFEIDLPGFVLFRNPGIVELSEKISEILLAEDPVNQEIVVALNAIIKVEANKPSGH